MSVRQTFHRLLIDKAPEAALPLLFLAQLLPGLLQYEFWTWAGLPIQFVDRYGLVLALCAYAAWLTQVARLPERVDALLFGAVVLAIMVTPLERGVAIPLIWPLQAMILVALVMWWDRERADQGSALFLLIAWVPHLVGTLTLYPICQWALRSDMLFLPGASLACNVAMGAWGTMAFYGAVAASWGGLALLQTCQDRSCR